MNRDFIGFPPPIPMEQRHDVARKLLSEGKGWEDCCVLIFGRMDGHTISATRTIIRELQQEQGGR